MWRLISNIVGEHGAARDRHVTWLPSRDSGFGAGRVSVEGASHLFTLIGGAKH